jgi:tetratricopeptide (TPR) repeat protein
VANAECLEFLRRAAADKGGVASWSLFKSKQATIDLTKANLSGLDLRGFDLAQVDFAGANLFNVDLAATDLSRASLTYADLRRANLAHAFLRKANLAVANLQGANLVDANLDFVNLRSAKLNGAYLMGASLIEANLEDATLCGANLRFSNLNGAKVTGADVEDANLCNLQLSDKMMRQFRNFDKALVSFTGLMKKPAAQRRLSAEESYDELFTDQDCFKILGVTRSATIEEIDKAYRRKAKEYHPDRVSHLGEKLKVVAAREFERIQVAYNMLSRRKTKPMMDLEIEHGVELPRKNFKDYTIDDWLAVIQIAPDSDRAHYNLGIKYFESGLIEMAIQAYRKAIELNPYNSQAEHNLKIALLVQSLSP